MTDVQLLLLAARKRDEPLLREMLSDLQDADDMLSEVIQDDPHASVFRAVRRRNRVKIRKAMKRLENRTWHASPMT